MLEEAARKEISGLMFYYYKVCTRKLWYFYHEIHMEQENENVQLGKLLDENSYTRENKHININDVINIDFIKEKKELHEIKKSRKIEEASIWQVKYYLFYLKEHGMDGIKGKIDYPLLRQSICVELTVEDEEEIRQEINEIYKIVEKEIPPFEKRKICNACAFFDLCAI